MDNFEIDLRMIYKEYGLKIKNPQYKKRADDMVKNIL